jgi:hypothetical protein
MRVRRRYGSVSLSALMLVLGLLLGLPASGQAQKGLPDTAPPKIYEIDGINIPVNAGDSFHVCVRVADDNSGLAWVTVQGTGPSGSQTFGASLQPGYLWSCGDILVPPSAEGGDWTIDVTACDHAGNQVTRTMGTIKVSAPPVVSLEVAPGRILPRVPVVVHGTFTDTDIGDTYNLQYYIGHGSPTSWEPVTSTWVDQAARVVHGEVFAVFTFRNPGTYLVGLAVRDGAGKVGTGTAEVTVETAEARVSSVVSYVQGLPSADFRDGLGQLGGTLSCELGEIGAAISSGDYASAAHRLTNSILPKLDGRPSPADWITSPLPRVTAAGMAELLRLDALAGLGNHAWAALVPLTPAAAATVKNRGSATLGLDSPDLLGVAFPTWTSSRVDVEAGGLRTMVNVAASGSSLVSTKGPLSASGTARPLVVKPSGALLLSAPSPSRSLTTIGYFGPAGGKALVRLFPEQRLQVEKSGEATINLWSDGKGHPLPADALAPLAHLFPGWTTGEIVVRAEHLVDVVKVVPRNAGLVAVEGPDVIAVEGPDVIAVEGPDVIAVEGPDVIAVEGPDVIAVVRDINGY